MISEQLKILLSEDAFAKFQKYKSVSEPVSTSNSNDRFKDLHDSVRGLVSGLYKPEQQKKIEQNIKDLTLIQSYTQVEEAKRTRNIESQKNFYQRSQGTLESLSRARDSGDAQAVTDMMMSLQSRYKTLPESELANAHLVSVDPNKLEYTFADNETNERLPVVPLSELIENGAQLTIQDPVKLAHALEKFSPYYKQQYQDYRKDKNLAWASKEREIATQEAHVNLYNKQAQENTLEHKLEEFKKKEEIKHNIETQEGKQQTNYLINNSVTNLIETANSKLLEINPLTLSALEKTSPKSIDPKIQDQAMAYQTLQNSIFSGVKSFRAASELKNIIVPQIGESQEAQVTKLITLINLYGDVNNPDLQKKLQKLQQSYNINSDKVKEFYDKALSKYNELQEEIKLKQNEESYDDGTLPQDSLMQGARKAVQMQNGAQGKDIESLKTKFFVK